MAQVFLEEQLKRIREMSEQMSRLRNRAAELGVAVHNASGSDERGVGETDPEERPRRHAGPVTPRRRTR